MKLFIVAENKSVALVFDGDSNLHVNIRLREGNPIKSFALKTLQLKIKHILTT